MFWILTPSPDRQYGVAFSSPRDTAEFAEITGGAHLFASLANAPPPPALLDARRHLIPRQFAFSQSENDPATRPQPIFQPGSLTYRFSPTMAVRGRFEKLGGGNGYLWGTGAGYFEYVVPSRNDRRRVGQIIVRAHIQPVAPGDADATPDSHARHAVCEWNRFRLAFGSSGRSQSRLWFRSGESIHGRCACAPCAACHSRFVLR